MADLIYAGDGNVWISFFLTPRMAPRSTSDAEIGAPYRCTRLLVVDAGSKSAFHVDFALPAGDVLHVRKIMLGAGAEHWQIDDIRVDGRSQFVHDLGPIEGKAFSTLDHPPFLSLSPVERSFGIDSSFTGGRVDADAGLDQWTVHGFVVLVHGAAR
jgi:hypothetical protein